MEWIKVSDRLPEIKDALVIGYFENGSIETIHIEDWFKDIGYGVNNYTKWYLEAQPTVTHWMPLPTPPQY